MKKEERRHGRREREKEKYIKAGECRSGGVELWRKIHTKHTHASTHTHAPAAKKTPSHSHTHKHTHTHKVN